MRRWRWNTAREALGGRGVCCRGSSDRSGRTSQRLAAAASAAAAACAAAAAARAAAATSSAAGGWGGVRLGLQCIDPSEEAAHDRERSRNAPSFCLARAPVNAAGRPLPPDAIDAQRSASTRMP